MNFLRPFVFNGTSSFDKIWESLGGEWITSSKNLTQYTIKGNKILVNVAGFEKSEIETHLDIENQKLKIQTPETTMNIEIPESLNVESAEQVKMSYKAGLLTFEFFEVEKEKAQEVKLDFI